MKTVTFTFHNETPEELAMDLLSKLEVIIGELSFSNTDERDSMRDFLISTEGIRRILALAHYNKVTKPVSDK